MRYVLMMCADDSLVSSPAELDVDPVAQRWRKEVRRRGVFVTGGQLRPVVDATTVRVRDGEDLLTDGPFAETKEIVGGFDIIECADLDEAIEIAAGHPDGAPGRRRGAAGLGMTRRRPPGGGRRRVPGRVGPGRGDPDPGDRRLGPGRGVRAGRVRRGAGDAGRATASPPAPAPGSPRPPATARSTGCAATRSGARKLRELAVLDAPTRTSRRDAGRSRTTGCG